MAAAGGRARWVAAATAFSLLAAPTAAAGSPRVGARSLAAHVPRVAAASRTVRAGATAAMRLTVGHRARVCELSARSHARGSGRVRFTVHAAQVVLTWKVPGDARALRWRVSVGCAAARGGLARSRARAVRIVVGGTARGRVRLFVPRSVRARPYRPRPLPLAPSPTLPPATAQSKAPGDGKPAPPAVAWGYATSGFSTTALGSRAFRMLQSHLGIGYARVVVPIDTVATALGGACDYDYLYAESAYSGLYEWLKATHAAGLTPLVSLTTGGAAMDNAGHPLPDESRLTHAQYRCGLRYLIETTAQWARSGATSPVNEWEVYNEPDRGLCAAHAAALYADAVAVERDLGRSDALVAGAFASGEDPSLGNHPDCGHLSGNWFVRDYVGALRAQGTWPAYFSLHPFEDAAASGAYGDGSESTGTTDTISYLNQQAEPPPAIWMTEVGVWLRDRGIDPAGRMLGQDINNSPLAQAYAAQGILNLAGAPGQAYPGQIERIYYYEFQTRGDGASLPSDHFDSALVGLTDTDWSQSGEYDPARGRYGVPRASYCVLAFGEDPKVAVRDPRCDFASSPHAPWTDWENPVHFPFGT